MNGSRRARELWAASNNRPLRTCIQAPGTERRKIFHDKADGLGRRGKATIVEPRLDGFGGWPLWGPR